MSIGCSNALDALPHLALLNYLRTPRPLPRMPRRSSKYYQRPPPPYSRHYNNLPACAPSLSRIVERPKREPETADTVFDTDEEARCGFWGEGPKPLSGDEEREEVEEEAGEKIHFCSTNWRGIVSLILYGFLLILLSSLGYLLSHSGFSAGLERWGMPPNTVSPISQTTQEVHFCKTEIDREAPTHANWRVMPNGSPINCVTEVLTLNIDVSEAWKLLSDDLLLVGESDESRKVKEAVGKFIQLGGCTTIRRK